MKHIIIILFIPFLIFAEGNQKIKTGADQPENYLSELSNKRVALVVNHTSMVKKVHLLDYLLGNKIDIRKVFAPEHGFRGDASAGEKIKDGVDSKTGVPVVSLYGEKRKPTIDDLKDVDIVVFDIQDVGCRFYTYISTLHYVIEACAENKLPLLVLDRPNPNGDYIAGPILEKEFQSFVGMHPIPIVHGCTVGELALMINGEMWHNAPQKCKISVIQVMGYTHKTMYSLPVRPSPNLPNYLAVRLYPSLCFFESTSVSVGRGTDFPFQALGGLNAELGSFSFVPVDVPGVAVNPLNEGKKCYGVDLRSLSEVPRFTLKYFLDFYSKYEKKEEFLTNERWLNLLAGTNSLLRQIKEGKTEADIMKGWEPGLKNYMAIRKKYLLYPDF